MDLRLRATLGSSFNRLQIGDAEFIVDAFKGRLAQFFRSDVGSEQKRRNRKGITSLRLLRRRLGDEVFVICILGLSPTQINTLDIITASATIAGWWTTQQRICSPTLLSNVSACMKQTEHSNYSVAFSTDIEDTARDVAGHALQTEAREETRATISGIGESRDISFMWDPATCDRPKKFEPLFEIASPGWLVSCQPCKVPPSDGHISIVVPYDAGLLEKLFGNWKPDCKSSPIHIDGIDKSLITKYLGTEARAAIEAAQLWQTETAKSVSSCVSADVHINVTIVLKIIVSFGANVSLIGALEP